MWKCWTVNKRNYLEITYLTTIYLLQLLTDFNPLILLLYYYLLVSREYTRVGCEFECAAKKARKFCQCIPWNYPNNFTFYPMCNMFSGHCFDQIMSDETSYKVTNHLWYFVIKIVLTYCEKKCSSDREKIFWDH